MKDSDFVVRLTNIFYRNGENFLTQLEKEGLANGGTTLASLVQLCHNKQKEFPLRMEGSEESSDDN